MKTTVNFSHFRDSFTKANRTDQFSYDGLKIIFDYIEQYEQDSGDEVELDVIGICCDFAEQHWKDIASDYSIPFDENENEEEQEAEILDYLADEGVLIGASASGVVYRQF
jgi:predicted ArsR family transcriptional regulator